MLKGILNEELSISNDVNKLTLKIKSIIGDDYNKNKCYEKNYSKCLYNFPYTLFVNNCVIKDNVINKPIHIIYYVLEDPSDNIKNEYLTKFLSTSNTSTYELIFYLIAYGENIDWKESSSTIQHEVEHLFQLFKKNKPLLTQNQMDEYNKMAKLRRSNDSITKIIGYTYYYYSRVEKNAIINELYREIMDSYNYGIVINPMDIIKGSTKYRNIQVIKDVVTNEQYHPNLEEKLKANNKTLKSFLRIANRMINEYTKAFGRLLYKANKDIEEKNKDLLINYNNELHI